MFCGLSLRTNFEPHGPSVSHTLPGGARNAHPRREPHSKPFRTKARKAKRWEPRTLCLPLCEEARLGVNPHPDPQATLPAVVRLRGPKPLSATAPSDLVRNPQPDPEASLRAARRAASCSARRWRGGFAAPRLPHVLAPVGRSPGVRLHASKPVESLRPTRSADSNARARLGGGCVCRCVLCVLCCLAGLYVLVFCDF